MAAQRLTNEGYFKFSILMLLFLLLAFDREMAMIYILIIVGDFIWYRFDPKITFNLERTTANRFSSLIEVGIATILFFLISTATMTLAGVNLPSNFQSAVQSVLTLLATTTPILAGNKILTVIGWGFLIPIIETSFFNGRLLEGLTTFAEKRFGIRISLQKMSTQLLMVFITVAAFFTLFHITAKNLSSTALLITFIFSMISSYLVVKNQELKQAVLFHMVVNTLAVLAALGWIFATVVL